MCPKCNEQLKEVRGRLFCINCGTEEVSISIDGKQIGNVYYLPVRERLFKRKKGYMSL